MTTEFDTRLNQWFDSVEPKHLPASILPQVFDEVDHTGQRRMPWHRFAASIELGWTRHSALPPALVMVILTALLLIALAAAAIAGGYVRLPERPRVMDGLIAVANELKNPDAAVPGNNVIRFIDPETGDDVYATSDSGSNCGAHFSPDGSRYVLLYQNPDQIGTGVVNIGVARSEAGSQPTFLFRKEAQAFFDPSWSPDGSAIVTTIEDATGTGLGGSLWVLRADGSVARQITDVPTSISASWSASGEWIAFLGQGQLNQTWSNSMFVVHPDGTELRKVRDSGVGALSWSPTADELGYAGADGKLHVINADGAEVASIVYGRAGLYERDAIGVPTWSPDGTRIALSVGGALRVIDVSSGSVSAIPTVFSAGQVVWSADGQRLVTLGNGGLVELSLDGSAPRLIARNVRVFCMSSGKALSWQRVVK